MHTLPPERFAQKTAKNKQKSNHRSGDALSTQKPIIPNVKPTYRPSVTYKNFDRATRVGSVMQS